MLTMERTQEQTAEYHSDLDGLMHRIISGETSTEVGLRRRLAEIAEQHYVLFTEAGIHLQLRFVLHQKQIATMPKAAKKRERKKIAKISPRVRTFLGLKDESRG